ncbi:MAG TPA: acyl-CoA synthetase [Burkholderiales bacterium]|nr:acyl-CoA synthetase [Burkholderiales bacterium]
MKPGWLRQRERSNRVAMRLLVWLALHLGRPAGRAVLYPVCLYFLAFSRRARAASRQYLARVLGRSPAASDLFRHYYSFATVALDRMLLLRDRFDKFDVSVDGEEIVREMRARGGGCFLLGAHLGSFEALRTIGRENRVKVSMLMFEVNPRMGEIARAINPDLSDDVIAMGRPDSMLRLAERLEAGEWVGMLGDRRLPDTGAVRVSFLGSPAVLPTAPFRIASMLERPVVLMVGLYRGGNRYELHFERLVDEPRVARGQREARIREWADLYARRLEHYCRLEPYNWFNFYDFWADADARA